MSTSNRDTPEQRADEEHLQEVAKDLPKDHAVGRFGSDEQSDEGGDSDTT